MARPTLYDSYGRPVAYAGYYQGGGGSRVRRQVPIVADDSKRTLTKWNRLNALAEARQLCASVGMVKGAVDDMRRYSVGAGLSPQSLAAEPAAEAYEDFWTEWCKICDVAGRHTLNQLQGLACSAIDVDGDIGFVQVNGNNDWPMLQAIEAHRIDSRSQEDGWVDGVRLNKVNRAVAYSIREGDDYRVVNARDFIHLYDPARVDQGRGITALVHALHNLRDSQDILSYEKIGVKMASAIGLAITKQDGRADDGDSWIQTGDKAADTGGLAIDTFQAGMIPRLRPGESIDSFVSNRPNATFQGFLEWLIRDVAVGLGLPYEFIWDSQNLNGTANRFSLAKAARRFADRQDVIIHRFLNRVWAWVIAKAIKRGDVPEVEGWWRVTWQRPAKITVDVGREATANRDDVKMGLRSMAEDTGERGGHWLNVRAQTEKETVDLLERAKRLADKYELGIKDTINLLRLSAPVALVATTQPGQTQATPED